jgi:hypothetical protein
MVRRFVHRKSIVHAQYHLRDNPEKGVGLLYNLFTSLSALFPSEIIDEKKIKTPPQHVESAKPG